MRAVHVTTLDGPDAIDIVDVADAKAAENQILIEVHAAGVTFPDVLQTRGLYQLKPPLPFTPGSEIAGVVVAAPEAAHVKAGDRVAAFPGLGGFAERVAADPAVVFPLPDTISFEVAAGIPMNYLTVHFALLRRGRLQSGETVLVHGAAGGIGTAAIQVAKAFGATVVAVVSSDSKETVARDAGADHVVRAQGFKDAVKSLVPHGVDIVVDPVGGDRMTDSLRCLRPEGRHLVIGFTAGEIPTVRVNRLLLNNIDLVGVGWGAFWMSSPGYLQVQWRELEPHFVSGALAPVVGDVIPLQQAADALRLLDERKATGKVVLALK
ncbi:NADPH:quinone oxidoreductase family protein [Hoyosella sp. YIM 151337]|uniref:NADPH:quinone oxidoreductase family protein n=1 Tax=Hoyosella sp. YIM 151337 TaxID=2992742 RepID=UPI00223648D7|nr:NADPH:quinone oxidoreductase family protein [Hoyosella sp. YIM 151337]MCW4353589.1 NADPH:quinone oxidoreductase family protein [Hoyosella sp. YIM 151337]